MKVSSTQSTAPGGVASSGSPSVQTGHAGVAFALLLGIDDSERSKAPPAKDKAGTVDGPRRKNAKDGDREGASSNSRSQTVATANAPLSPAIVNDLPLTAGIAAAANGNADIPAGISSAATKDGTGAGDLLGQTPRAPMGPNGVGPAIQSDSKGLSGRMAISADDAAIEANKSGDVFVLPATDATGKSVESSSKPTTITLDNSVAAPGADAANGTAKNDQFAANGQVAGAMQSLMQTTTGRVIQVLQDAPQITHMSAADFAQGSRAVEVVQAGTAAGSGTVSPGIETSANLVLGTGVKTATTEKTSGEQVSGADSRNVVAPPIAVSANQPAGGSEDAHGGAPGEGAGSSGSGESVRQTPSSKQVLTAADLSQVGTGPATPAAREGAAASANLNSPATHSAMAPISQAGVARVLQSAMRGDVRVGLQTEAFGRVTIQTVAGNGQLSAQLSLENVKQSAALALHLPAVEQKLAQQYGLNASVNLAGASSRDTGGMTSGGRGSNPNNNNQQNGGSSARGRTEGFNPFSSTSSRAPAVNYVSPLYRGPSLSQTLDVIV